MKKTLALAAVLSVLLAANSWAAPTATIGLNNYGTGASPIFYNAQGTLAPLNGTFVELLQGGTPVVDQSTGQSIIPLSEDGMFYGGIGTIPGLTPQANGAFTLRAWRGGATYAAATEKGEASWTQATGSWDPAATPPTPPIGPDMTNPSIVITGSIIPEPSTIALGLLGGAALLMFRRK